MREIGTWHFSTVTSASFKLINDNFGFATGDAVLRACSRMFQDELESSEYCVRVSADNFVLLVQYTDWDLLVGRLESCEKD